MANLKVPSLQHLARIWNPDPVAIARTLVALTKSSPTFSYSPLYDAVRDMCLFGIPEKDIIDGFKQRISRPQVRDNFVGLMPLIANYFRDERPAFFHDVAPRIYPVSRNVHIPFSPPFFYGRGGHIQFPWLIFWRHNPLVDQRLSLFVSVVDKVLLQDPDLDSATFKIVDFSATTRKADRELKVLNAAEVPRVSSAELREMLDIFTEGYRLAIENVTSSMGGHDSANKKSRDQDGRQPGLFD